jgi:ABC-2 type transport system permease protein
VKFLAQLRLLLVRNLREGVRNPVLAYGLPVVIPLSVLILVSETLLRVTDLPGFPTNNYAEWMTPAIIMVSAMTGVGYSATSLIVDIQSGFLDRLRLLDARPSALLVAGVALGASLNEGVLGALMLFALLALWAAAYGGLYFVVALTTRNAQAPLALAPLFLPLQFLSTQFVPASLLPSWVRTTAEWNPFNYMIAAARALTTGPLTARPVIEAVAVALGVLVVTMVISLRAFSRAVNSN